MSIVTAVRHKLIALAALEILCNSSWNWKTLNEYGYIQRTQLAAKAASIIAHDRMLNCEQSRGLPSHYGDNGHCG